MVNPLVHAVANSLGRSTPCGYTPIARAATGHAFRSDFFTPRPRPSCKGKERAVDPHSVLFAPQTDDPQRCTPGPLRHRVREPKRHSMQRRHASSSSTVQQRYTPSSPPLQAGIEEVRLRLFIELEHEWSSHEAHLAWLAYQATTMVLKPPEMLRFATKLATSTNTLAQTRGPNAIEQIRSWGQRILEVLDGLQEKLKPESKDVQFFQSVKAQAFALSGDLGAANALLSSVSPSLSFTARNVLYDVVVTGTRLFQGPGQVLDFVAERWSDISPTMSIPSANAIPPLRSLQQSIHQSIAAIPDHVAFLSSRPHSAERGYIGELFIHHMCKRKLSGEALRVLRVYEGERQRLPDQLHLTLVRGLAKGRMFADAVEIFEDVLRRTFEDQPEWRYRSTTGLYLYARQGDVPRAEAFFSELEGHTPSEKEKKWSWVKKDDIGMIMFAYATARDADGAADLFVQFFPMAPNGLAEQNPDPPSGVFAYPDIVHYTTIILAYAKVAEFAAMNRWLAALTTTGFTPDRHLYTILLRSFAKRGDVASVGAILDQMLVAELPPDAAIYTVIITLFANRRDPVSAEAIFNRGLKEGIVPDRRLVTILMEAHAQASSWQGVVRIFDYIASSPSLEIRLSVEVYNTLLKAYVKLATPFSISAAVFGRIEADGFRPTDTSYSLLLQSAVDQGKMTVAEEIFEEMDRLSKLPNPPLRISTYALNIMLAGYIKKKDKSRARTTYADLRERGLQPDAHTFASVLRGYVNEGTLESLKVAEEFLATLVATEDNIKAWNKPTYGSAPALDTVFIPLMSWYALYAEPEQVERLFQLLMDKGGQPSITLLSILMDSYRRVCDWDGVEQVWNQILELANTQSLLFDSFVGNSVEEKKLSAHQRRPSVLCIPLSIYADAMSVATRFDKVAEVWGKLQSLGFAFDSDNWNHLVTILHRAGEYERAFQIVEHILLPYQRESQMFSDSRDRSPPSPIMFDTPAPVSEDGDNTPIALPPAVSDNSQRSFRRVHKAIRNRHQINTTELLRTVEDDPAHSLHVLHNSKPQWDTWKPFAKTFYALHGMLTGLRMGIPPHQYDCLNPKHFFRTYKHPKHKAACRPMLKRFLELYPNAIAATTNFILDLDNRQARVDREHQIAELSIKKNAKQWAERDDRERGVMTAEQLARENTERLFLERRAREQRELGEKRRWEEDVALPPHMAERAWKTRGMDGGYTT